MPDCPIVTKIDLCVDTLKLLLLVYRGGLCRMGHKSEYMYMCGLSARKK